MLATDRVSLLSALTNWASEEKVQGPSVVSNALELIQLVEKVCEDHIPEGIIPLLKVQIEVHPVILFSRALSANLSTSCSSSAPPLVIVC